MIAAKSAGSFCLVYTSTDRGKIDAIGGVDGDTDGKREGLLIPLSTSKLAPGVGRAHGQGLEGRPIRTGGRTVGDSGDQEIKQILF